MERRDPLKALMAHRSAVCDDLACDEIMPAKKSLKFSKFGQTDSRKLWTAGGDVGDHGHGIGACSMLHGRTDSS